MIDRKALLSDLQAQVKAAETDLEGQVKRDEAVRDRLRAEYDASKKVGRTAATWQSWLDERITQVAVAWVLGTVFVRFVEDNGLVPEPYITAPDIAGREVAQARYDEYVDKTEDPTYRGWFERAFEELAEGPAGALLFSEHNPLRQIPLSHEGAGALRDFWQRTVDDEAGTSVLVHDFTDPLEEDGDGTRGWDTRFLGDLYQDLSEAARKNYALLQTPEFVEEFILDRTMNPVVRERGGVEDLKMIDPTCGSGHFVLGAFRRLVRESAERRPELDAHARVRGALESVHGVDINPFAVAIARFRLLIAAMGAAGVRTLGEAAGYDWPMQLAVGDSLIRNRKIRGEQGTFDFEEADEPDPLVDFRYTTEDVNDFDGILQRGKYDVVVGNPPYITVKDKKLNELYRSIYDACQGTYALSVPFAQRFFELAKVGEKETGEGYGRVGQITANSFMKREFGTRLIESFFGHEVELREVIDTSGAYIPGHGTPTVILVGTRRAYSKRGATVRTVRSVQGEPSVPEIPEEGLVWRATVEQIDAPGSKSQWVSVADLERGRYFAKAPWILADGGAELDERLSADNAVPIKAVIEPPIGRAIRAGADEAYIRPLRPTFRTVTDRGALRPLMKGDIVRDWIASPEELVWYPYSAGVVLDDLRTDLWPLRTILAARRTFQGDMADAGLGWWDYMQHTASAYKTPLSITFAEVATHNHFVLDRGGKVFKQTAPVIKLREEATEGEHLQLLGVLNSSTAGFWLRMVCHDKGNRGGERGTGRYAWESYYQFNGANVQDFPLPRTYPTTLAVALDTAAQQLTATTPTAVATAATPTAATLRNAHATYEATRARMIALQEELDWQVYSLYGLTDTDLRPADPADVPPLALGERAFEIVLARAIERGEASSEWFTRHNSTPITELPGHWPAAYKDIVNQRIAMMESNSAIGMVERPEYKRRWATEGWDAMQKRALRAWLLDRIEAKRELWFDGADQPTLITLPRLTDRLQEDDDFAAVLNLYAPRADFAKTVAELVGDQHVPAAAALRYKPAGLKKRADWERTWEKQRAEDAATSEDEKRKIRAATDVPPKYTSADFLRPSFWAQRGKLDVPKERFISYGAHNTQTPALLGWAGWDHLQQAQAIVGYLNENELTPDELTPYLAALLELQPWLDQWHGECLPDFGQSAAQAFHDFRLALQGELGLTDEDLRAWRPAAAARGGRAQKTK
ncbi:BREX-2 system adenine-specific DNA-methyltransferase PglX [Streptomyces sp. NBC_01808]|uniref:BREX-2 system adenine-specific DNA-methyltransferase PglX n=1 Tax=Streptomyces sp. NBC_01808 TaxID=2975947 RepID=UPI002DD7E51E|nr:BREX-2 system adenine-specific DNA-methyltransferase PglX [Streptomyces sp. NBC_01808]WSA37487.1 BREX-2 system adenine-specific DNA-methyltransferase PglX [Streptomyces sp. NBC_01808]